MQDEEPGVPKLRKRAAEHVRRLRGTIAAGNEALAAVDRAVEACLRPDRRPYVSLAAHLDGFASGPLRPRLLQILALELAARFETSAFPLRLPGPERAALVAELGRVVERLEREPDDALFRPGNDGFLKELGLLSGRLCMLGDTGGAPRYVDPQGQMPRAVLYRGGPRQSLQVATLLARTGGFSPYLAHHVHALNYSREDPGAWVARTHRVVALMALNPQLRGLVSGGWLNDPQLATVSPHLAYMRKAYLDAGATPLFLRLDREGTSGALDSSKTRRALFDAGRYVPQVWVLIWPRAEIARWAKAHPAAESGVQEDSAR